MTASLHRDTPVHHAGPLLLNAAGAVVLLHGRGASAADILSLAPELDLPRVAFLAPDAANHTWYPYSFLAPLEQNEPWLSSALAKVGSVVETALASGIARAQIVLCGFSQGACLATEFVARNPLRYGGLIALTGGLIGPPEQAFAYSGDVAGMPAFFGSGDPDPHVPWARVQQSATVLETMGAQVTIRRYPGRSHTISLDEIAHARKLLASALASDSTRAPTPQ